MVQNKKHKRIILILIGGLAVFVLAVLASRKRPPAVLVATVAREDVSQTIASNGKAEPISAYTARAEFPTFVDTVAAAEGQALHRGQIILTLDAADVQSQLAQARASLLAAGTDLQNAKAGGAPEKMAQFQSDLQQAQIEVKTLERNQKALEQLATKQAATLEEVAENQASLSKALARLQALEQTKDALVRESGANIESASLRVEEGRDQVAALEEKVRSARIIAPTDGTLYSLPIHKADYVKVGDVLAEMADLRHVRVRAFVDEPDLGALEPGQRVRVTWDAKPGRTWIGRTEQIPKQVVPHGMRSVAEVLCSVDNNDLELLPNVNVEVSILVHERSGVLVVPRAAVRESEGKHYVFLLAGDTIRRRDISIGIVSSLKYEVSSGLAVDDRVVLPGDRILRDGMKVRVVEAD